MAHSHDILTLALLSLTIADRAAAALEALEAAR
jgi:hypothetical protein